MSDGNGVKAARLLPLTSQLGVFDQCLTSNRAAQFERAPAPHTGTTRATVWGISHLKKPLKLV